MREREREGGCVLVVVLYIKWWKLCECIEELCFDNKCYKLIFLFLCRLLL